MSGDLRGASSEGSPSKVEQGLGDMGPEVRRGGVAYKILAGFGLAQSSDCDETRCKRRFLARRSQTCLADLAPDVARFWAL